MKLQHGIVQYTANRELVTYIILLLSTMERVQLSEESDIKIMSPSLPGTKRNACYMCVVSTLKLGGRVKKES